MLRKMMRTTFTTKKKSFSNVAKAEVVVLRDDLTDRSTEASERSLDEIYVPKTFKCQNCGCTFFVSQSSCDHLFCGKDCLSTFSLFHTIPSLKGSTTNPNFE
jgi:hypothetical protein